MKKSALLLAIAFWFLPLAIALAQPIDKWSYVAESGVVKYFATSSDTRLNRATETIDIWVLMEYQNALPSGLVRQENLMRFDIQHARFAFKEIIGYADDGSRLFHVVRPDEKLVWKNVAVQSVGQALFEFASDLYASMMRLVSSLE
ncbi:MAG: hypothetical protein ACK41G_02850 [Candidatus Thermochlorobacter sp.]